MFNFKFLFVMAKNRLDYQAQLSRHNHNISAGYTSSIAPGPIVPQYFHVLNPGDSIYYKSHLFARLQDVVTAFIGEVDLHVDYFFVPLQMLFTPFGSKFAQTNDYLSSCYYNIVQSDDFPVLAETAFMRGSNSYFLPGHFECLGKEITRLADALNVNPYLRFSDYTKDVSGYSGDVALSDNYCHQGSISPWVFAAYQAIYQKYYRNDELERFNICAYNFDNSYNTVDIDSEFESQFTRLRYCQRPSDYFTTVRVSPIASSINRFDASGTDTDPEVNGGSIDSLLYKVNDFLGLRSQSLSNQGVNGNLGSSVGSADNTSITDSFANASTFLNAAKTSSSVNIFSAQSIRTLFAVDKFTRIWGRADKTYDDQILAHFGIKIPHDVKHDLTHLNSYRIALQSDPIYGTANVPNADDTKLLSSLGQVGGQGQVTLDTNTEKFTAPVHGVFMAVLYAVTKPRYFGTFSKLHYLDSRLKFPIPEFDKLGAQPLYDFESDPLYLFGARTYDPTSSSQQSVTVNTRSSFHGWQNRYNEFKQKYNRVSLTYVSEDSYLQHNGLIDNTNVYQPWVISRLPFAQRQVKYNGQDGPAFSAFSSPFDFFERPDALDPIMVTSFVKEWSDDWYKNPHLMFQSDPIITEFYCDAKLVSWMSETGEPDL